jgi:hypothetical protein
MRTFPKSLATLRRIVDERGETLRKMSFNELTQPGIVSIEDLTVDSRPATIWIHVQPMPDGGVLVVVRGSMKARFIPVRHLALDGFHKDPDGRVAAMEDEERNEFG